YWGDESRRGPGECARRLPAALLTPIGLALRGSLIAPQAFEKMESDSLMARRSKSRYGLLRRPTIGWKEASAMAEPAPVFDVVVAGGGASGLALAAAIKQAMGQGASVAVVDPGPPAGPSACPLRTVAIADGPRRLLEQVGAWEAIAPKAQPILSMAIMDGDVRDAVRLPHLKFAAKDQALAHMAFNDDVVGALSALCDRLGVQRVTGSVAHWASGKHVAELGLSDGRALRARLAVAPNGARSKLSRLAGIQTIGSGHSRH